MHLYHLYALVLLYSDASRIWFGLGSSKDNTAHYCPILPLIYIYTTLCWTWADMDSLAHSQVVRRVNTFDNGVQDSQIVYNLYILYRLQVYIYIIHAYPYTNGERDACTCVRAHVFVCLRMSFLIFPCAYSVCMYPRNRMHCHWSSWDLHTMCSCFSAYGILWVHLHGTCRLPLVTSHTSI